MPGKPVGNPTGIKQSAFREELQGAKDSELTKCQSVRVGERSSFEITVVPMADSSPSPTQAGSLADSWTDLSLNADGFIYCILYKALRHRVTVMRPP